MLYNFVNQDYHCLNEDTKWNCLNEDNKWKKGIKKIPTNICKWPFEIQCWCRQDHEHGSVQGKFCACW